MTYDRNDRIRRAAILVASLEQGLADAMLRALPAAEVDAVHAELDQLDEVDPDEQRDVLDEFRRRTRRESSPSALDGVEYTPSREASEPAAVIDSTPRGPLHGVDHQMLGRLLSAEHPQTIAAALSRLGSEQGAAVFATLSAALQGEVIERICNLQTIDDAAAQELETHLVRRASEWQRREERQAASVGLARALIAQATPAARDSLLGRIAALDDSPITKASLRHDMPAATPIPWTAASADRRAADLLHAVGVDEEPRTSGGASGFKIDRDEDWSRLADDSHDSEDDDVSWDSSDDVEEFAAIVDLDDCSRELSQLADRELVGAIQQMDEQTVLRALAASSEQIVRRVAKRLSRQNAARLRSMIRSLGPTRLAELRLAQHQLLAIARETSNEKAAA